MRSPTTLFSEAWQSTTQHLSLFAGVYAVPVAAMIVYDILVRVYAPVDRYGAVMVEELTPFGVLMTVGGGIVLAVLSLLGAMALLKAVSEPSGTTFNSAYRYALSHFFSFLWLSILVGLATMLGFILLIIPGIIVYVWLIFAQFIFVQEGKRGVEALRASREYVRGRWWQVCGRLAAILLLTLLLYALCGALFGMFIPNAVVSGALLNLIGIVFVPFLLSYVYLMYVDVQKSQRTDEASVTSTSEQMVHP